MKYDTILTMYDSEGLFQPPTHQIKGCVLMCWGCRYKLPQTGWHKKPETCFLTVLEVRSLNPSRRQGHARSEGCERKGRCFLASSSFRWLLEILGIPWLIATPRPVSASSLHMVFFPVWISVYPLLLQGHQWLDLGPTLIQYDLILIYILVISAKTLFPNKVTVTSAGG